MGLFSRKPKEPKQPKPAQAAEPTGPAPRDAAGVLEELRDCVVRLAEGRLRADAIEAGAHIFDHGYVDSFRSAELLAFIDRRYGVQVPEMQLVGKLCTLAALAKHVEESVNRQ